MDVDLRECPSCGGGMVARYPRAETKEQRAAVRAMLDAGTLQPDYECIRCGTRAPLDYLTASANPA